MHYVFFLNPILIEDKQTNKLSEAKNLFCLHPTLIFLQQKYMISYIPSHILDTVLKQVAEMKSQSTFTDIEENDI